MKKDFLKCYQLTIACISTLVFSPTVPVLAACSNSTLKGNYTYSEQGSTILPPSGVVIPITEVGILSADGESPVGHFTSNVRANWGNQPIGQLLMPLQIAYTTDGPGEGYIIKPDCTGTATFTATAYDAAGNLFFQAPGRTAAIVTANKQKFQVIITSQGTVASGTGEKIQ